MILKIKKYGHPILRKRAELIKEIDEEIIGFASDMCETISSRKAIGLSANQAGVARRIFVAKNEERLLVFINPKIISQTGAEIATEGCLSFPGLFGEIERATKIVVSAISLQGKETKLIARDLLARAIQHEIDHLDGILFIDRADKKERKKMLSEWKGLRNLY
ncbi:peptide deformylase [bacterium]|nr:peptide deformylase [bacterium]MBU1598658.1 peptide deformylase [bacterium]MBU2462016.1 peptide deformylase [bacterium]